MSQRADLSKKLIHFTRGPSFDEAFGTLLKILSGPKLIGGTGYIRKSVPCVCFTEAPLSALREAFSNSETFTRYRPFGLMFDKAWIFEKGGRPVIYQADDEYELLDKKIRWRHVLYDPISKYPVDFTWEREWRIPCDELPFSPADVTIILPSHSWVKYIHELYEKEQKYNFKEYSKIYGDDLANQFIEDFPWDLVVLSEIP